MPTTYLRRRRKPREGYRRLRVLKPKWIDPFPSIQGSSIEKMVLAEFVRRGIYFEHTPQRNSLGGGVDPTWEPDFLLPQYHIWIEIQGSYFHTLPKQVQLDATRFALVAAAGWKPIWWWEDDIRTRLSDIMNEVPEFYRVEKKLNTASAEGWRTTTGYNFYEGGDGIDHLKGLRVALAGRARPPQRLKKKKRVRRRPK